ncbi:hypothetical protein GCM10010399_03390 [Dactylosporangium fulvum]
MLSTTGSPLLVSGTMFAATLPWLLFSLVSGALVDRLDRRRTMVAVDACRAVAAGALGVGVALDRGGVWLLYAALLLFGTGETLFRAAGLSMMPALVPPDLLERANGRLGAARTVAHDMLAGPLGGFLFAASAAAPFVIDGASFAVSAVLLAMLPMLPGTSGRAVGPRTSPPGHRRSLRTDILEGARWLLAHRLLRTLAVLIGLLNVTLTAALAILALLATERLGLGSVGYGLLFTALAVGGLVGSLFGEWFVRRFTARVTLRAGLVVEAAFHLCLAVSDSPVVAGLALGVFGIHGALWTIVVASLRQRLTPGSMLGRVNSAYLFLAAGGNAIGALLGGVVTATFGVTAPYWIGFVVAVAVAAATWRVLGSRMPTADGPGDAAPGDPHLA